MTAKLFLTDLFLGRFLFLRSLSLWKGSFFHKMKYDHCYNMKRLHNFHNFQICSLNLNLDLSSYGQKMPFPFFVIWFYSPNIYYFQNSAFYVHKTDLNNCSQNMKYNLNIQHIKQIKHKNIILFNKQIYVQLEKSYEY